MNVAAMSVTAERAKQVMFSAPYADTSLAVYGPKSADVKSAADVTKVQCATCHRGEAIPKTPPPPPPAAPAAGAPAPGR